MRGVGSLSIVFSLLALMISAGSAAAATVEIAVGSTYGGGRATQWQVRFTAAPGEANRVRVTRVDDYTAHVHEANAPLTAGDGCHSIGEQMVECTVAGRPAVNGRASDLARANVSLGDGDDVLRSDVWLVADAGAGNDSVEGSLAADELDGGGGTDELYGALGVDQITDGDVPGAADADLLDAGADGGTVSYATRTAPVVVRLATDITLGGEAGELDELRGFTSVTGGAADDVLEGTDDATLGNRLTGGEGDDRIVGLGGNDWIDGGPGGDRLEAGDGDDMVIGSDGDDDLAGARGDDNLAGGGGGDRVRGQRGDDLISLPQRADSIACGHGEETLYYPARGLRVQRDCEHLFYEYDPQTGRRKQPGLGTRQMMRAHPRQRSNVVLRFLITCPQPWHTAGGCADDRQVLRLRTADGERLLGRGRLVRPRRPVRRIDVHLNRRGRRLAARARGVVARVTLTTAGRIRHTWKIRVRT